ncbi:MAG: hypothetical protein AAGA85_14085 [Bacteroidota bacterium]
MNKRKILVPLDENLMTATLMTFMMRLAAKNDFSLIFLKNEATPGALLAFDQFRELEEEYGVDYRVETVAGDWIRSVNELGDKYAIDLVALSTGADSSRSQDFIAAVERPMLIFPNRWAPKEIKKIGFACDNHSFQDSSVLSILWYLAIELKAEVYIIHISDKPVVHWELNGRVEDSIEFYLQDVEHHYEFIHSDNVANSLLDFCEERGLDMLATMPRDHQINRLEDGGKVTGQLIEKAPIPIITID